MKYVPGIPRRPAMIPGKNGNDQGTEVEEQQDAVAAAQPPDEMPAGDPNANPSSNSGQSEMGGQPPQEGANPQPEGPTGRSAGGKQPPIDDKVVDAGYEKHDAESFRAASEYPPESNSATAELTGECRNQEILINLAQLQPIRAAIHAACPTRDKNLRDNSSNGAGNQDGIKDLRPGLESRPVKRSSGSRRARGQRV